MMLRAAALATALGSVLAATPPGPGPFDQTVMLQPVPGALRFPTAKICDVSKPPYSAAHGTNATAVLAKAIVDCGDLAGGGVVVVPAGMVLYTASLFMRSNLTLRVEDGATLFSTATGSVAGPDSDPRIADAPIVWARRNALMTDAHAGMINGGVCLKKAPVQSPTHPDGCMTWHKLENVVIEGGGTTFSTLGSIFLQLLSSGFLSFHLNAFRYFNLIYVFHQVMDSLNVHPISLRFSVVF